MNNLQWLIFILLYMLITGFVILLSLVITRFIKYMFYKHKINTINKVDKSDKKHYTDK